MYVKNWTHTSLSIVLPDTVTLITKRFKLRPQNLGTKESQFAETDDMGEMKKLVTRPFEN